MFSKRLKRATILLACVVTLLCAIPGAGTAFADQNNTYTVQPGDTLAGIAMHHGVGVGELAEVNGLLWNSWVYTGQKLVLPGGAASEALDMSLYETDSRVPDPLPQLPVLLQQRPSSVLPLTYARVAQTGAPVYAQPFEAALGLPPKRELGAGFVWVSVMSKTSYEGTDYYEINTGEYVLAEALSLYDPSEFQGVALAAQPERPFAWILKAVQPALEPGGEVNPTAPQYQRYQLVQIFATEQLGDQVWYLIGPHQWINQVYVGKVEPSAPPAGVEADETWIEVNLFEQTLAAYVGERMVYATLISSGLPGWNTPQGLSRTWLRVQVGKMSGGYNRPDYYFLEDVPWTMYFNRDVALHTAYWHDGFGYRRSHGCVNLAPLDARWLYDWAPDEVWVWVHADS
jgi:lipoprotein-anchoring transpeptidase ErfK/SrfK/LysM repeat protein